MVRKYVIRLGPFSASRKFNYFGFCSRKVFPFDLRWRSRLVKECSPVRSPFLRMQPGNERRSTINKSWALRAAAG